MIITARKDALAELRRIADIEQAVLATARGNDACDQFTL